MAHPSDLEAHMAALEARFDDVTAEAAAARHLAAARDRDLADLPVKVDANRKAINALGVQTAARFDRLEEAMANGFIEMRGKFDATAAGQQQIVTLLTTLIGQQNEQQSPRLVRGSTMTTHCPDAGWAAPRQRFPAATGTESVNDSWY